MKKRISTIQSHRPRDDMALDKQVIDMNTLDIFEINTRISKRMWKIVSFAAGINSTLEDTQLVSYEDGDPAYRAICRALAWEAMKECDII